MAARFDYHDPGIESLLILSSYFYLLNVAGSLFDHVMNAGLLGQILVGIIWGTPLAGWLLTSWQETFVDVGYIGLLLIVFEGGASTSLSTLTALLPLSTCVALTGLLTPIALSFILTPLASFPLLHSFAAGAALSSTSLGTVLTLLVSSNVGFDVRRTKLGTALLGAAVMDDVVAFILSEILSTVGENTASSAASLGGHIGRTIGVTLGIGLVSIPITLYVLRPFWFRFTESRWRAKTGGPGLLFFMTILFLGLIAGTRYAGTSPLYGAYIAGLIISYLTELDPVPRSSEEVELDQAHSTRSSLSTTTTPTLIGTFERYITPSLNALLLPLFFGSIGYSIPFIPLWKGRTIWKGLVYSVLMALGKALCGIWVLVWNVTGSTTDEEQPEDVAQRQDGAETGTPSRISPSGRRKKRKGKGKWIKRARASWRGALLLGFAMIARGEIGLLISQIANQTPTPLLEEDEFLITIWAIVICTIVGPAGVGWGIKRWGKRCFEGGWD